MLAATTTPRLSADSRIAGWLLVALLAHALLLLIPSQRDQGSRTNQHSLTVSLQAPTRLPFVTPAAPLQELPAKPASPQAARQATSALPVTPEVTQELAAEPPQPSTAYLLNLAGRHQWRLPAPKGQRELGVFMPRPPPSNWRPAPAPEANRSVGMTLPADTGAVDRWLAADGSHNVVITAPDGETYCGRAEAWNPMNPLVEPIMTYRSCGAGKRTFDMPQPYGRRAAAGE